ncbi:MAG: undecaprenyl-diphosphatase UppP [Anaerolineales bacterium]
MTILQAIVLGVVQGATEFLPISSSGHLVLIPWLFGWQLDPTRTFVFDVLVQWGTLLAVIAYFRRELIELTRAALIGLAKRRPFAEPQARLAWLLVLASLPAAALGLAAKSAVEAAFTNPPIVSLFLLATAALLTISERVGQRTRSMESLRWTDALVIGLAQSLALLPGISRSGSTIAGGLVRDMQRPEAARFSFLMSIPIMIGAGLVALLDLTAASNTASQLPALAIGFLSAAVVGYLSIRWLIGYLQNRPLTPFIVYCAALGLLGLLVSVFRG